ncbi:hypothetical protein [Cellulophaga sp. HaHa_2_1]|uniref:hypothetical protein n=1 Tax=Cellulophaga sp. HaHa_2_1 TaxID=2749994 RepID=UPI002107F0C5|nr:hypothetical protein [Cellulophaga sp. HaHa_2_1]
MKKWLVILLYYLLISCIGQEKSKTIPTENIKQKKIMTTEKFDIATFEENKVDGEYNFIKKDGTKVRQTEGVNDYSVYEYPEPPSFFMKFKRFSKETKILQQDVTRFPNRFLVLRLEYDNNGKLMEEQNYNIPYKFTFEQLLLLLKNEQDTIDIFDKKNTTIGRKSDESGTFWFITYYKVPMRREVIKVDGVTGEILERSFYPHEEN